MKRTILSLLMVSWVVGVMAQDRPPSEYGSGLKVDLNESGSKYFRLITWHQFWLKGQDNAEGDFSVTPSLRRSRFLMYAQLDDRFLILTHFGLNNLSPAGMDPVGYSPQAQLFMHDAWVEYKVGKALAIGGGLHYWNGISRLNNQSTLNILPIDNPRMAWTTIGTTDQFARHLGVYAKGKLGKLDYRVAWNKAMTNSLDQQRGLSLNENVAVYRGAALLGPAEAGNIYQGYFMWQFLDQESNKLPYLVGSYLGTKRVFNVGAGFFFHQNGTVNLASLGSQDTLVGNNVLLFAVDAFLDLPFGDKGSLTAYLGYYNNDFGPNYQLTGTSQEIATGQNIYTQVGYLLPSFTGHGRLQPYFTYQNRRIDALDGSADQFGIGANWLINEHNAKISMEYNQNNAVNGTSTNYFLIQGTIFL
ncbi:MAG: porin [Bacteroidota bacterium]|nr:porin [Bacteroidota bacterium]MDX5426989.1 porin [Bacteroidota bacterium]MDX5504975.1 porin [Bacteroidota bacterium]